jgi:hypothetical protein
VYLHSHFSAQPNWTSKLVNGFMVLFCAALIIGSIAPLWLPQTQSTPQLYLKSGVLLLAALALNGLYWQWKPQRLLIVALVLLVGRIGFNWFVLPDRNAHDYGDLCRKSSIEIGQRFRNQDLYVYGETPMQWTNSIYMTIARGKIIPIQKENFDTSVGADCYLDRIKRSDWFSLIRLKT